MTTATKEREIELIDVEAIRANHPLLAYVAADVSLTEDDNFYYGACPFCGEGEDRFKVFINGQGQYFNCRRCDRKGDVIKYVMETKRLEFVEACRWLDNSAVPELPVISKETASKPVLEGDELQEWRNKLEVMTAEALRHLLRNETPETRAALSWLAARGITREVIEHHGIGFNDRWREIIPGYKLPPGITIPRWRAGDVELTAANIYLNREARLMSGCKRMYAKGSQPKAGFWNGFRIPKAETVFIFEGELDAALMSRFLTPLAVSPCPNTGLVPKHSID